MGQLGILNERLVRGIKQDQRLVGTGVVHPFLQLGLRRYSAGGVVGIAEVNQVNRFTGNLCCKPVVCADRQVGQAAITAVIARLACAASHHIAVDVNRIHRIGHCNAIATPKDVENIAAVAFGAIRDKDLLCADLTSPGLEVIAGNRLAKPAIALFRPIAAESFRSSHLVDG